MNTKTWMVTAVTFFIFTIGCFIIYTIFKKNQNPLLSPPSAVVNDAYFNNAQKIFDNRCVACHSCFNSPCQLNLTSYDGALRGASHANPYDFPLIEAQPPTRLGIDAQSENEWRNKGFFSVLEGKQKSTLLTLVTSAPKKVDRSFTYEPEHSRICPKTVDSTYLKNHSMPFGFPGLKTAEIEILKNWVANGYPGPRPVTAKYYRVVQHPKTADNIEQWEDLLNTKRYKHQLSARYFYEHLFSAHINFENDTQEFFRIVRAKNRKGHPDEIATVRPFDDPKTKEFYYRFKKINQTIVHKTHTVFVLNHKKFEKFKKTFIKSKWENQSQKLPGYSAKAANAFLVFKDIPVRSRYEFFLDNARYFIMTFIKGPVCRGQTALNVINDHFWVMFIDPDHDVAITNPKNFAKTISFLTPPASYKNELDLFNKAKENRWIAHTIKTSAMAKSKPLSYKSIWNGEPKDLNKNALLTVYRHFDSASVLWGAKGVIPKTIWVMDYQIFEDIYYNLVAGYNVFGPVLHQLNTRLYMDISRISSEDMFLNFMPENTRPKLRATWTQATPVKKDQPLSKIFHSLEKDLIKEVKFDYAYQGEKVATTFIAKTKDPKIEFLHNLIKERFSNDIFYKSFSLFKASLDQTPVNLDGFSLEHDTREALYSINGQQADYVKHFPDVTLLRLKNNSGEYKTFSIVRNRFHYNVSMMFFEDTRENPEKDTLDILPEYAASYPNYYLDLNEKQLRSFIKELKNTQDQSGFKELMDVYGVPRSSTSFWAIYDWFNNDIKKTDPLEAGVLDLNRYANY